MRRGIVTAGRRLDACELAGHKSLMTVHHPDLRATPALALLPKENEAGGILTVDLGAIEANWKLLASMTLPVECAAVVKANAYGCGLEPVTRKLAKAGCRTFFVADFTEARSVRAIAADATIYVLGGMMPGSPQACAEGSFRPVSTASPSSPEWDAFVTQNRLARRGRSSRRYRHEPAWNNSPGSDRDRSAHTIGKPRVDAVDEPSRLCRNSRSPNE